MSRASGRFVRIQAASSEDGSWPNTPTYDTPANLTAAELRSVQASKSAGVRSKRSCQYPSTTSWRAWLVAWTTSRTSDETSPSRKTLSEIRPHAASKPGLRRTGSRDWAILAKSPIRGDPSTLTTPDVGYCAAYRVAAPAPREWPTTTGSSRWAVTTASWIRPTSDCIAYEIESGESP